ncbi:FadR/GntR family transcriptional regulator [Nocardioides hwasunensis]|uniref:Winged helix-turn-helix transcriptional regulator n=1 Tax=Nocardioides hwasunensis TaxID=397258 RepID=A0ABR8MR69_9ACTN|nr:winged helix-turn-helix domain-containing protein [Nocardioides hwasunensis]MBD3916594.1 winged helix-turn-helix transcriptional regulator [Nocardioides hwasunensis]
MPEQPSRNLPPLRRERLYESLAAHISDFIEAQGLVGGDRLPPERQLAADLGVSRATLSRALASLETRGRIEVRHGVGALVRDVDGGTDSRLQERVDTQPQSEVAVARESMLAGLARAAAVHPNASLRLAMLADDGRPRSFEHTWRCVRRLADSPLLVDLDDLLADKAPPPADSTALRQSLDVLAEAVIRGDASAAATACAGMLAG